MTDETTAGATILLVEDEPAVRSLFAAALSKVGYRVIQAKNGEEALKLWDELGATVDLLLTDMRMPYVGGAELTRELRAKRPDLKLICISGYPGNVQADAQTDFLAKPFSREEMLKKVRDMLDRPS